MGGFKRSSNNEIGKQNLFDLIISHIAQCCKKMQEDCKTTGQKLYNHEDKISNRLVERYLDLNILGIRFTLQNPEHYDFETDTYMGRTDIKVMSSDWFNSRDAYYTIECKRLDGKTHLNKEYICEGISRFVLPSVPKYSSYYRKNIMLGYIVQTIDASGNVRNIDELQRKLLVNVKIAEMKFICDDGKGFSHYQCLYQVNDNLNVELTHLFHDFSSVMCKDK